MSVSARARWCVLCERFDALPATTLGSGLDIAPPVSQFSIFCTFVSLHLISEQAPLAVSRLRDDHNNHDCATTLLC